MMVFLFIRNTPWIVFAAGLPLILTAIAFTSLGESLRDILDPKLHQSRTAYTNKK